MFEEASHTCGKYSTIACFCSSPCQSEAFHENVKDGLRVTGWGIFDFNELSDGLVVVIEPPHIDDKEYDENRFFFGVVAGVTEKLDGQELRLDSLISMRKSKP